jgi:CHAT domain-containing protein
MQLNADLVTLSACNTGVGKYYKGEGIVSLARGFMYAGVPNVMMSLWSVADRPTRDIMQYFYEELDRGIPYATALHNAKLRYLASADNLTADPYYWGSFIYLGQPIGHTGQQAGKIWWITGFILIVFLIAGGVILFRKKYFTYLPIHL